MSDLVEELQQRAESFSGHLYAADLHTRAAVRIEALESALRNIKAEAERPQGNSIHLKRVVALQCQSALAE